MSHEGFDLTLVEMNLIANITGLKWSDGLTIALEVTFWGWPQNARDSTSYEPFTSVTLGLIPLEL